MKKFIITIDEIVSEEFEVRAETLEEAMEIAKEQYNKGLFEGTLFVKQMSGKDLDTGVCTEWTEF